MTHPVIAQHTACKIPRLNDHVMEEGEAVVLLHLLFSGVIWLCWVVDAVHGDARQDAAT